MTRAPSDPGGPAPWPVAAGFPVATALCVVAIVVLELRIAGRPMVHSFGEGDTTAYGLGTGLVGLTLGLLAGVILRTPGHRVIGLAMGGAGLFWAADGVAESWVRLGLVTEDALPGMTFAVWFLFRFTALLTATVVLLPLIFPDGRFLPGAWGAASWACMGAMVLAALSYVVVPYADRAAPDAQPPPGVDLDPTTIEALAPRPAPASVWRSPSRRWSSRSSTTAPASPPRSGPASAWWGCASGPPSSADVSRSPAHPPAAPRCVPGCR